MRMEKEQNDAILKQIEYGLAGKSQNHKETKLSLANNGCYGIRLQASQ